MDELINKNKEFNLEELKIIKKFAEELKEDEILDPSSICEHIFN